MTDLTAAIDAHLTAYCDPNPSHRTETVARVWAADGQLIDPPFEGQGRDAIGAMTDGVLAQYPDHTFRRVTTVDEHHGYARYGWVLARPDGAPAVTGTDFAQIGDDGRLLRIVGFFGDPVPAKA